MEIGYRRLLPRRLRRWLRGLVVECGMANCRGFHLSHPTLQRLPGIYLDRTWYCSPECLREALKRRIEEQLGAAITDLRHPPRMPFRLILLAGGKVSAQQLEHARTEQAANPAGAGVEDLGDALVRLGYVSEEDVAAARAAEAGCLFFGGAAQPIPAAYSVPLSLIQFHRAAPVHYSPVSGRLLVGFVYRIDSALLQAVEQVTGCRVEACIITASAWRQQQRLASLTEPPFAEVNETGSGQGLIVSLIVNHAIASLADKVHLGLTHTALWARLAGGPRALDLVIDLTAGRAADGAREDAGPAPEVKRREPRAASRASRSVLAPDFSTF